jgi:hypothetical protein
MAMTNPLFGKLKWNDFSAWETSFSIDYLRDLGPHLFGGEQPNPSLDVVTLLRQGKWQLKINVDNWLKRPAEPHKAAWTRLLAAGDALWDECCRRRKGKTSPAIGAVHLCFGHFQTF